MTSHNNLSEVMTFWFSARQLELHREIAMISGSELSKVMTADDQTQQMVVF